MILEINDSKQYLTIIEAAKFACVSRSTIVNWITEGLLPCIELPGRGNNVYCFRRICRKDLDEFLELFRKKRKTNIKEKLIEKLILLPRSS